MPINKLRKLNAGHGSPFLFVYGTLREGCFNQNRLAANRFTKVDTGWIEGTLWVKEGLPMAKRLAYGEKESRIYGEVYAVGDWNDLYELDKFEGHPTWYSRTSSPVEIEGADAYISAYVYFINDLKLPKDAVRVESGDYKDTFVSKEAVA